MAKAKGIISKRQAKLLTQEKQRFQNAQLEGAGANGKGDRTAAQAVATHNSNPYFQNNFIQRWQQYALWYYTSWEAQKIVNIPVDDALREPFKLVNISDDDAALIMAAYDDLGAHDRIKRALYQERMLGGSVIFLGARQTENVDPVKPLNYDEVNTGDLRFLNTLSVDRVSRATYCVDPFSKDYDTPIAYRISGIETDVSRLLVFDGSPVFSRDSATILQGFRVNPSGFGESKLAALYDSLIRCVGTQQGAYQLVNMASVILAKCDNLMSLQANGNSADQLADIVNQISIYRAALLTGKDMEITQHSASFGSVPELVMTFAQLLSAASDIPATRFLGQAPGGLNATGDSDLENYYNMIAAYQKGHIKKQLIKLFDVLCPSVLGREKWRTIKATFDIEFTPLWNLSEVEQSTVDKNSCEMLSGLFTAGILSVEQTVDELTKRNVFETKIQPEEFLQNQEQQNTGAFDQRGG